MSLLRYSNGMTDSLWLPIAEMTSSNTRTEETIKPNPIVDYSNTKKNIDISE